MARKKMYLVLDTETQGNLGNQIAYDIGFAIIDREGRVYHSAHYLVKETFSNLPAMATAYYSEKFPEYIDRVYQQRIKPKKFTKIVRKINELVETYNISTIAAYNLPFDIAAMKNTAKLITGNEEWLEEDLETLDIWSAACETLCLKKYVKKMLKMGKVTEKGNIKTSAETVFQYLTGDWEFVEEHMGLDDVLIECQILAAIFRQHKKFTGKVSQPWRLTKKVKDSILK